MTASSTPSSTTPSSPSTSTATETTASEALNASPGASDPSQAIEGASDPKDASEGQPEASTTNDPARKLVLEASRRERLARKREKEARELEAKLKAERAEWEAKLKAQEELFQDIANHPEKAQQLLQRAGLTFDDFARAVIGLEPAPKPLEEEVKELKSALQQREEAEAKAKKEAEEAEQKARQHAQQEAALNQVTAIISETPDAYPLLMEDNGYRYVLAEVAQFIHDNYEDYKEVLPEELPELHRKLVTKFAEQVENRYFEKAKAVAARLVKFEKLKTVLGINTNNNQTAASNGADQSHNDKSTLDPESASILESILGAPDRKQPSKFITNDGSLVTSAPVAKHGNGPKSFQSNSDDEIQLLLKKYGH